MQGMKFVCIDDKGQVANSGHIVEQITPERYLCQFLRAPTSCKVCRLEEIEGWNLFPTAEQAKAFVEALKPIPDKPKSVTPIKKPEKKKGVKKNVKK